ncbi:hypothetical protein [Flavobacterium sp.]|uniref:hypothetical protein n=1 Tax=Flavobacterium sp. TaxID=239 RepID=UPI0035AFF6B1
MNKPTHLTKLIVSLSTAMFLLTGCATAQKEVAVPKPKKNIDVYIDNTADLERQKNAVETYVWAINDTDSFKVEVNADPKVYPLNIKRNLVKGTTIYCDENIKKSKLLPSAEFVTFNYEYPDYLMDQTRITVKYQDKKFYDKKYSAKVLENESFEIIGFDSKKEALDIFIELMRSTTQEYKFNLVSTELISTGVFSEQRKTKTEPNKFILALHKAPKPTNEIYSIDYWDLSQFFPGRGFVFDPYALENENRLIVTPIIKLYSLKHQLLETLVANGYNVVDEPQKASLLISSETLYYGSTYNLKLNNTLTSIQQYVNDPAYKTTQHKNKNVAQETGALVDQASTASSMGNTDLAKGFAGAAAANLVLNVLGGDEKQQGYFISYAVVKMDNKDILKTPNYLKLSDSTEVLNQTLCIPQIQALKSSKMFLKSIESKLTETTK